MNKLKTLNRMAALYVFSIMLLAGILTLLFFFFLAGLRFFHFIPFSPIPSILFALLLSNIIGTSLSVIANEKILKPLNQLMRATEELSSGNFDIRVKEIDGDSEIAGLLKGFNRMARELGSIEMFRSDFINNFSHEIRTPIAAIRGFAKQLQNNDLSPQKRKEYSDIIDSESRRLDYLASNILLLANLENQEILAGHIEYKLDEQIRDCLIRLENKWANKDLEIDLDLSPVKITADEEMLSRLLLNLIDNAIKYSKNNGKIAISCRENEDNISVGISDNGIGMDNGAMKHIFDKFYQGDRSHSGEGNGLGLAIAKRIAELHGGKISAESAPGTGSTFTVLLPKHVNLFASKNPL